MITSQTRVPTPTNEPTRAYAPGTAERGELKAALQRVGHEQVEIPALIGGREYRSEQRFEIRAPFEHARVLATSFHSSPQWTEQAIANAMQAKREWAATPFHQRAAIFLRAAELLATKHRAHMNAVTMWGQAKTAHQSEIDAACEASDFLRFNVAFAEQILGQQPASSPGVWNQTDYRPLDGFVLAVAPFNFTSIALNLCTAPALMGNVVLFKPAETATLSAWMVMQILREAGLPDGVINFLPGHGAPVGNVALQHPDFGGLHFTGSSATFNSMWKTIAENVGRLRQYPRIVGETGGKDFIFVHPSAADDLDAIATAVVRGGFEFQGQKCSACSRVFIPRSLWPALKDRLVGLTEALPMGPPTDFRNFVSAVIDDRSFIRIGRYLEMASGPDARLLAGGHCDRSEGWYVRPTLVEVDDPRHPLMTEEIFGPLVSMVVYPDGQYAETLRACDEAAGYALTGSIFARDRAAIAQAALQLRSAAGNFYINDKPTGAVVGQQPFGGSRASGTNDKAGSWLNLLRWTSPRTIKETFVPSTTVPYPFMAEE